MAALTADRLPPRHKEGHGEIILDLFVAASEVIYRGAFVEVDAGGDITAAVVSTGDVIGIAQEQADNASGADGDITCKVMCGSVFEHAIAAVAKSDIGAIVRATDDQTLDVTTTANNHVGWILQVPATGTAIIRNKWIGQPSS